MTNEYLREMYLDLLRKSISGQILEDPPKLAFSHWTDLFRPRRFDAQTRDKGKDWPTLAHTMIGGTRLKNLQKCMEDVLSSDVPGDFIETGVWRGGATIFMRGFLKAHGVVDRRVWVADSFAGLPRPNGSRFPTDRFWHLHRVKYLSVSEAEVRSNFEKYGLLDEQVRFLRGWFRDTLPTAPIEKLAVLRLDGDLYESTTDALTSLYPKLSVGGYVIVDDYVLATCAQAVTDFRQAHGICDEIVPIDGTGIYWKRSKASAPSVSRGLRSVG